MVCSFLVASRLIVVEDSWNILGWQGALLAHLMFPVYMSSLILSTLKDDKAPCLPVEIGAASEDCFMLCPISAVPTVQCACELCAECSRLGALKRACIERAKVLLPLSSAAEAADQSKVAAVKTTSEGVKARESEATTRTRATADRAGESDATTRAKRAETEAVSVTGSATEGASATGPANIVASATGPANKDNSAGSESHFCGLCSSELPHPQHITEGSTERYRKSSCKPSDSVALGFCAFCRAVLGRPIPEVQIVTLGFNHGKARWACSNQQWTLMPFSPFGES